MNDQEKQELKPLLPCPFCGELPKLRDKRIDTHPHIFVECINMNCYCHAQTVEQGSEEDAIKAWNQRDEGDK